MGFMSEVYKEGQVHLYPAVSGETSSNHEESGELNSSKTFESKTFLIPYSFLVALAYAGPVEEPEEPNEEYGTSRGYGYIGFRSFSSSLPSVESLNRLLGWLGYSNSYVTYE